MANPSPQHNPTDGLGTATQITLTSNGTGGSALTTVVAGRIYTTGVSVSGATINGVVYGTGFTLTATVKDVGGSTFSSGNSNSVSFKSYNTGQATVGAANGVVASVAAGQAIIEVKFPTFDTTDGIDFIYGQVIVNVYP